MTDVKDQILALARKERGPYRIIKQSHSFSNFKPDSELEVAEEAWRRKLCDWCYDVVDTFGTDREIVSIALNYFDRYNTLKKSFRLINMRSFQLLAVTCLFIAHKIYAKRDEESRKLTIDAFERLSRDMFCRKDIESKEIDVLRTLQWLVNPPTSLTFLFCFLEAIPKRDCHLQAVFEVARYLCEVSVCIASIFLSYKQSVIAYASIICGIESTHSSLVMPASSLGDLYHAVSSAANKTSSDPEVLDVCSFFKTACPDLFNSQQLFDSVINTAPACHEQHRECSPSSAVEFNH
jgi:hypothetical protein